MDKATFRASPAFRPPQPYEAGNTASVRHGVFSERLVSQRAAEILARLRDTEDCKWLSEVDSLQIDTWLKARARYEMASEWIDARGLDEVPDRMLRFITAQERNLMRLTQDLGLDPTGRYKLLKDVGWARHLAGDRVGELARQGREIRRGRS